MYDAEVLWQPTTERIERTQMNLFMHRAAKRYGFAANWSALHQWSVTHRDQFWREMLQFAQVNPIKPASATVTGDGLLGTKWFDGMELNFAAHLTRFDDQRIAIESEDELGRTRSITYSQLRSEVARCASAMRSAGVQRADRVGGFLPNFPPAIVRGNHFNCQIRSQLHIADGQLALW